MESPRLNKDEILANLSDEYDTLHHILAELTVEDMTIGGVCGVWSIKDIIAHLSHWNQFPVKELSAALQGEDADTVRTDPRSDEEINAEVVNKSKALPVSDVLGEFAHTYQIVIHNIAALSDEAFEPNGKIEQLLGDTVSQTFANNTYEHWAEHRQQIEAWLQTQA